jgi:methionyl-tRNA formyltransferase
MRILCLVNNWVGWQVLKWLKGREDPVIGLVIHPPAKRRYGKEILGSAALPENRIFDGSLLRQPEVRDAIRRLKPDIGLSLFFDYILKPEFLRLFPAGVLNLHPSYLPCNRGQYPNVWSIVDGTPSGVTLHYLDAGIDTGDIIAQRLVPVEPVDTGESLYRKLERACLEVFMENWPGVVSGKLIGMPQPSEAGTYHRTRDVEQIDEINLEHTYTARKLIDILRARTFPPYRGAFFRAEGRKVYLRLQMLYEDDLERNHDG